MAQPTGLEEDADELPQSPEFGQLNVVVTPPVGSPVLPTPEFGSSSPSPSSVSDSPAKVSPEERESAAKKVALPRSLPGIAHKAAPSLAAPNQTSEVSSPNFGSELTPNSPAFGDGDDDGCEEVAESSTGRARRPSLLEEPQVDKGPDSHPATPDFGSLQGPLLDEEAEDLHRLGSASSSPPGSSPDEALGSPSAPVHRNSVDMLLPSTGETAAAVHASSSRFNFGASDEADGSKKKEEEEDDEVDDMEMVQQLLEREQAYRKELARRDRVLNWYHEELLSTQDELDEAKQELYEQRAEGDAQFKELLDARRKQEQLSLKFEASESSGKSVPSAHAELEERYCKLEVELADREDHIESCYQRLKEEVAEQSLYSVLHEKLAEAEKLQQEVNATLRLENDDLAFDVRELRAELATAQRRAAEEATSLRVSQQEATALGDALERAEGAVLVEATTRLEAQGSKDLAAELSETRQELAAATREALACKTELEKTQEGSPAAAAEIAAAVQALMESRADVEAATAEQWRAAEAFDQLANVSKELEHVKASAAADRSRHDEALASVRAAAQQKIAVSEQKATALTVQLQSASSAREAAESRLALAEAKVTEEPSHRQLVDGKLEAQLANAVSARERASAELADARALAAALRREAQEEALAKQNVEQRLSQAEVTSRALSAKAAAAATSKADAEAHLTEVDEVRLDLQRQLQREGRRRSSLSLRLEEAEHDAENSGGRLAAALAAKQAAESRLAASEAVNRSLEATLAQAETLAADSGSHGVTLASFKVRLSGESELAELLRTELSTERSGRTRAEGQLRQHCENALKLEEDLEETKREVATAQIQLSESNRRAADSKEESAALRLTVQHVETRMASLQGTTAACEAQLTAEGHAKRVAEEALSALQMKLVGAASVKERLEASEEAEEEWCTEFAAALAAARDVEEAQQSEIAELQDALATALQQRRAALQASERAQAARLRQKEQAATVESQALKLKTHAELRGEALSASIASALEESGAVVREQHASLLLEVRALHASVTRSDGELHDSKQENAEIKLQLARLQREAVDAAKTAASEKECCEMLLHQLEEVTLQSISSARVDPPEVQRLREEISALQVRQLQSEAASVKHELQDVRGATRALADLLGVHYGGHLLLGAASDSGSPPRRRRPAAGHDVRHFSSSVCASMSQVDSPHSGCRSQVARSEPVPLPWGPPPAVVKDLPFSASNSPASGSWRQDKLRPCSSTS